MLLLSYPALAGMTELESSAVLAAR